MKWVIDLGEASEAIDGQIGLIDSNKIITPYLFSSIPHLHNQITAALDTCLEANPSLTINAKDILDIVQQMNNKHLPASPEDSMQLSRIDALQPQWLTPQHPCFGCGEAGHWEPDCPACIKAASARASSSKQKANVSGMGVVLSLGQFLSQGVLVRLDNNILTIQKGPRIFSTFQRNHRWFLSLISASRNHIVHALSISSPPPVNFSTHPSNRISSDLNTLWHCCMGHLSIRNIKRLLQFNTADGIPNFNFENIRICHPCSISKDEHCPFKSPSQGHINAPGDLVAADLIGPLPESIDNKKYALMIQDSFSRMTAVIPLNDKMEAKQQIQFWILRFNNATDFKIKSIRTDNGMEFCNHFLRNFLKEEGITHELSILYKHHQNGKIERTNRTISEMARTSLLAANLPHNLWPYAFKHAVWIFNRTLHADIKLTPYETVGKRKPSLLDLRVFGSKSYIFNHSSLKNISAKGSVGYHLGITPDSKGWLFWIPDRKTVIFSASVRFDKETPYMDDSRENFKLANMQVDDVFDVSMIKQIELQDSFVSEINSHHDIVDIVPISYNDALISAELDGWKQAIDEEFQCMKDQDVFEFHDLGKALWEGPRELILSTKWVFTKKTKP
ncbi:hypothetical protein O181_093258 [Austropuccinia psidii MF-1]|uniref:Integrase catalytic domain-containing protein n=1 Tax=Austropuccinia psidii MF-1 TaxID=1389203 RepID=A0A9Q3J0W7_9BASI|nr:hypothetical protein [Austropuccinia psidii MF-1]